MSTFIATPTIEQFMLSQKYVRILAGPIGSGKSVACTHDLIAQGLEQQPNHEGIRKSRFLIVRNTADQLRSTTQKTVFDWIPDEIIDDWKVSLKELQLKMPLADGTTALSEWMFIALDTPDDVRKALSLESTGLWGNESRELHPDVVDGLLMRVNRYPSMKDGGASRPGAIFDTNMPDIDSWWHDKMENPPPNWSIHIQPPAVLSMEDYLLKYEEDPEEDLAGEAADGTEYAVNPACDNFKNLAREYYPNTLIGKKLDFINVYLRSRYGRSLSGLPVYDTTFDPDFHIAEKEFAPITSDNYPITIGLDFGRTPAAVFMQMNPWGQVVCLSEVVAHNMGLETFIKNKLKPHIYANYQRNALVVAADPSGWFKQQLGEVSPVDVLKKAGFKVAKPATNLIEPRIQAVERLLSRYVDGHKPGMVVNKKCVVLVQGFRYGYRYKLNKKGVMDNKPDKNDFSHPHDGCQYGSLIIDLGLSGQQLSSKKREVKPMNAAGWT